MSKQIKITEEDIFKFVLNPESLPIDVFEHLSKNSEKYSKEINFCREIISIDNSQAHEIEARVISMMKQFKVVELYPQVINLKPEECIKLVAASEPVISSKPNSSFSDAEMNYLIRLVNRQSQTLLYFFTKDIDAKRYKIKFVPSENEYLINDINKPIEVFDELNVEKIIICTDLHPSDL